MREKRLHRLILLDGEPCCRRSSEMALSCGRIDVQKRLSMYASRGVCVFSLAKSGILWGFFVVNESESKKHVN